MDERTAEHLLYVDATLTEMSQLAARGRTAYDSDIAVARACQYNVIRLAADLERLGEPWLAAHPTVPWRIIKGMRSPISTRDRRQIALVFEPDAQCAEETLPRPSPASA